MKWVKYNGVAPECKYGDRIIAIAEYHRAVENKVTPHVIVLIATEGGSLWSKEGFELHERK